MNKMALGERMVPGCKARSGHHGNSCRVGRKMLAHIREQGSGELQQGAFKQPTQTAHERNSQ